MKQLQQCGKENLQIDVLTTLPNRYASYQSKAKEFEQFGLNYIYRVKLPFHQSGMIDQAKAF